MSLIYSNLRKVDSGNRKAGSKANSSSKEVAVPGDVVRLFKVRIPLPSCSTCFIDTLLCQDASGIIGTPRKPCWSCHFLSDNLHLKNSSQPLFTLPPLPSPTPVMSLASTNARLRPWKAPEKAPMKAVLTELHEMVCREVEAVLMKEVRWREKASLAEKWARRRREGGESDGGCWLA